MLFQSVPVYDFADWASNHTSVAAAQYFCPLYQDDVKSTKSRLRRDCGRAAPGHGFQQNFYFRTIYRIIT